MIEGDIKMSPGDLDIVDQSNQGDVDGSQISVRRKRNAARDRKKLWVTRVVPYEYDSSLPGKILKKHSSQRDPTTNSCITHELNIKENKATMYMAQRDRMANSGTVQLVTSVNHARTT